MNFETYFNQAWSDHATQTEIVASGLVTATSLVESNEQLAQLVGLITHVLGEHLGRWTDGQQLLTSLQVHPKFLPATETENAILRSIAVMQIGSGQSPNLDSFSLSQQIRVMAVASSALSEKDAIKAKELLDKALALARTGLNKEDPTNRALAVTGNNLASALEQKKSRSPEETELMILAAQTGRKYWQIAGNWNQVAYAEYRLTMTYVQANEFAKALQHAQQFAELCQEYKAEDRDFFYCYEALAVVERARKNEIGFKKAVDQAKSYFEKLSAEHKAWCEPEMMMLLNPFSYSNGQ